MKDDRTAATIFHLSSFIFHLSHSMERTYAGTLRRQHVGQDVALSGWVQKQRDFGELIFIDLRDRSGIVQVIVDRARGASEEVVAVAKEARSEFVVRVEGTV